MLAAVLRRAVLCLLVAGGTAACAQEQADTPAARQQAADRSFLLRRGMGPSQGDISLPMHMARSTQAAQARGAVPLGAAGMPVPALSSSTATWQPAGPTQLSTPAYGSVTGRISSLAVDPNVSSGNTVYLGATGGGVWKSINAAGDASSVSFIPLTDDLPVFANSFTSIPSLSIGAITVQPGNPQVLLAGTGDPNNALDSYYGVGILRSGDGGNTWKLIQNSRDTSPFILEGIGFSGFAWSKKMPGLVVAAASQSLDALLVNSSGTIQSSGEMGLYYSSDAGQTWYLATVTDGPNSVIQSSSSPRTGPPGTAVTSVVWNSQRNLFLAAIRSHGYYSSPDGMTWTRLANQPGAGLNSQACRSGQGCPIFRGVLAVQQATGDTFALTTDINNIDQGLYQDVCSTSGLAVRSCNSGTIAFGTRIIDTPLQSGNGIIAQADYNLALSAVPTQSQQDTILFAGTEDIFRCSLANSCTWRNTTNDQTCAAAQVAPSTHAIEIGNSANGLIYFGNDGGLWRTTDVVSQTGSACAPTDASHYQNLNGGIGSLAEISHLAVSPANGSLVLAGMGGFGVVGSESASAQNDMGAWQQLLTGEGSFVAIDPNTPNTWYADSGSGVSIFSCGNGGNCNAAGFGNTPVIGRAQVADDADYFVEPAPWILDPLNPAAILLGTCRMWLGPVSGNWTSGNLLSTAFDTKQNTFCNGNATIRSVGAGGSYNSPQGGEQMYAGMAGPHAGGGTVPGHLFGAVVPQGGGKVTWSDLWRNPVVNVPLSKQFNHGGNAISSIAVDPHDVSGKTIYAGIGAFPTGSDGILYGSTDGGQTWNNLTNSLPFAPVTSVVVDPNNSSYVYVGGDFGVYYTPNVAGCAITSGNFQSCWGQLGSNLPNAPVTDLKVYNSPSGAVLEAATYGRGIWTIALPSNAVYAQATLSPGSYNFGSLGVGTTNTPATFLLSNTGAIPLNIGGIAVTPTSDYLQSNNCGSTLAGGSTCTIQVNFTPSATGDRPGSLTVSGNVQGGVLTSSLDGTGLPPAVISVNPGSLTFGTTATGSTSPPQTLTIQNTGGAPLQLGARTFAGASSVDYTLPGDNCGSTLAAKATCQLPVAFAPTQTGTRTAQLQIASNDKNSPALVSLSGMAVTPAMLSLAPSPLAFPNTATGNASAVQNIVLTNKGGATAQLGTPTVGTMSDYQITANGCGSVLIGNGASCTIGIVFVPASTGSRSGLLTVPSQSVASPVTATLNGNGVPPPNVALSPNPLAFGNQQGTTQSLPVTVTNSAGSTAQLGSPVVTGTNFAFVSNACAATLPVGSSCTLMVSFTPPDTNSYSGIVTLPVNKTSVSTALSGRGTAPAKLTFTPPSLTFDTTAQMTTSTKSVSVMNSGANPATITSPLTFTGPFSLASSTCPASPQTLAAGATCTLQIAFTPPGASQYSGTIAVNGSFSNSPAQVTLSGLGATPPAIKFFPANLGFSGTAQGSASPAQSIEYGNTGGTPAVLGTPSVTPDYWISFNNCPSILPVGSNSCHVQILFHPTALNQRNGTFSQSGNQINSPTTAALAGTGLPHGPITLDQSSLTFGPLVIGATSAPQTITITNTSAAPVSLGSLTPSAEYVQTGASCSAMLAAGDTCTVSIAFQPTIAGPQPILLEVPDDGSPSAAALTLDGIGMTPKTPGTLSFSLASLAFGTVATGSSVSKTVMVTNGGENPVHLSGITASGITASGDFAVTGGNCTSSSVIAASASCTVVVTFSPTAQTSRSGTLTITGDGTPPSTQASLAGVGAAPASVTLSSSSLTFGQVANGSTSQPQVITATNSGGVPVNLSTAITGTGYSVASNQCASSLAPNAICTLQITFAPKASGDSAGMLNLQGAYSGSPSTVMLDGSGVTPGMLVLSPNPVSFGIVVNGSPARQPVTLQNTGGVAVPIGTPYATPASYAVTSSCGGSIAPGAGCTLQVSFTPGASGMLSGLLTVPALASGSSATAALGGTGVPPGALAAAPAALSYPDTVTGGTSSAQVATFKNSGGVVVPLVALQVSSTDFTITKNGCGASLDPGAACSVTVVFNPANAGVRSGMLRLTGGGGVSSQVALSGRGLAPARLAFSPASLSFAPQNSNTTSPSQVLTLQNSGDVATSLSAAVLTGEYLIVSNSCGSTLAAAGTCQIAVQLAPQDAGNLPGSLAISSPIGSLSATAALSGSGLVLEISPTVPAFSQVLVGTSVTSPTFITVENLGKTTLPLQLSLTGDFSLGVSSCGPTLPANSSCSLQVTFTPTTNGLRTGTFTVSDGVETHSVQLSGTGLSPATDTLSVTVLSFPNTQLGSRSASQAVLVTNSGDATLALISTLTNGPFSTANGCGASLGGHLSCTIAVSFVPATVGPATGTLTINDTISFVQHSQVVTLSGQGTPPPQAYTAPSNIDFGPYALSIATPPQIVTVSNPGSSAISNLAPSILGSDFSMASDTCASSLASGASCQIGVVFTPSVIGNRQGTLTVQGSGASFGEPLIVSLTGSGEDFQFNVSGSATATITSGQTAAFPFNVTPSGTSTGSLGIACSGAPVNATCTVNPASLSLAGGAGGSFKVSVATGVNATAASLAERHSWLGTAALAALCPLLLLRGERRRRFGLLLVALALLGSPIACGVSASGAKLAQNAILAGQTPSGSYPITITVSFPGAQRTATITVIVQ